MATWGNNGDTEKWKRKLRVGIKWTERVKTTAGSVEGQMQMDKVAGLKRESGQTVPRNQFWPYLLS